VELQTLSPSLPAVAGDETDLREIAISAQIEGEFFEVLGFLFGLNEMDRLVRVDGISASSSVDESGVTVLAVGVQMTLFTLADLLPPLDDIVIPGDGGTGTTTTTLAGDAEAGGGVSP
jgi:hypothetical protein